MPPAARICLSIEINISKHICHLCHIFLRYPRCACTLQRQCFQSAHALLGYRVKLCDMSSSKAFTQVFSFRYVMPWNMRAAHTCIPVASGSGNIYKSISARVGLTIPAIIVSSPRHLSKDGDRYITVFVLNDSAWNTRPRAFCEIRNCNFWSHAWLTATEGTAVDFFAADEGRKKKIDIMNPRVWRYNKEKKKHPIVGYYCCCVIFNVKLGGSQSFIHLECLADRWHVVWVW